MLAIFGAFAWAWNKRKQSRKMLLVTFLTFLFPFISLLTAATLALLDSPSSAAFLFASFVLLLGCFVAFAVYLYATWPENGNNKKCRR
ncbi:MAG: hypothetical protein M1378_11650 [Bacteroidetes bacterium]|nr:hypothetical protein [Bacteroidota bacterium]